MLTVSKVEYFLPKWCFWMHSDLWFWCFLSNKTTCTFAKRYQRLGAINDVFVAYQRKNAADENLKGHFVLPQRLPTSAFLTCNLIVFIISCYECMIPKSFSLPLKQKNTDNISLNRDERDAARLSRCCAVLAIWTLVPPWRSINADLPSHHHHSRHHKKPSAGTVIITTNNIITMVIIVWQIFQEELSTLGCPKKSKSPNFGMPLTPVVFIG